MFIYLDESGTLTESDGKYFIVATYTVDDTKTLTKAFKKWQKTKFPKKLQKQAEIKFNNSHINDALRLKTLQYLAKQSIEIFYTFLKKKNIPQKYCKKGRVVETGLLYTEIVRVTLELYIQVIKTSCTIVRDQRRLKNVTVDKFNTILEGRLLQKLPRNVKLQIQAVDSTSTPLIQIADWICGALARYYEEKPTGDIFYRILKGNIVKEKEIFPKVWTKVLEK